MTPDDLVRHNCLISRGSILNNPWPVRQGGSIGQVAVNGTLRTDSSELVRRAALAGLGIMMGARWRIAAALHQGAMVAVLPEFVTDNRHGTEVRGAGKGGD